MLNIMCFQDNINFHVCVLVFKCILYVFICGHGSSIHAVLYLFGLVVPDIVWSGSFCPLMFVVASTIVYTKTYMEHVYT